MDIIHDLSLLKGSDQIFILGFFDGIHQGHLKLFQTADALKKKNPDFKITVCSFEQHPQTIIRDINYPTLFSWQERQQIFKELEIDFLYIPMTGKSFFKQTAGEFIEYLMSFFQHLHFITGDEAQFGCDQLGGITFWEQTKLVFPDRLSYELIPTLGEKKISSSGLRQEVQNGEIQNANDHLYIPFFLMGEVIHGNKQGRLIGFPTLNVVCPKDKILPPFGVYKSVTNLQGQIYHSLTYISNFRLDHFSQNPLFETWLVNFNQNIYGKIIQVYLLKFQRPPIKISSLEELRLLLEEDKRELER